MAQARQRKCLCCGDFFDPDHRAQASSASSRRPRVVAVSVRLASNWSHSVSSSSALTMTQGCCTSATTSI